MDNTVWEMIWNAPETHVTGTKVLKVPSVQYQPLADTVWRMLCLHLHFNLRTTCLFARWSHPLVFVPNCPLTQRYITGPTHCCLLHTLCVCVVLCQQHFRKTVKGVFVSNIVLPHLLISSSTVFITAAYAHRPSSNGSVQEERDLNVINTSFTSNRVEKKRG